MKQLHSFIHKEAYTNHHEINVISKQAIHLLPNHKIYYISTWDTIKQQIHYLPRYTICIQILLVLFQLYILQSDTPIIFAISIVCALQICSTCSYALRANVFGMGELEQVSRCSTTMLFFIRYIIISFFLYPSLCVLILYSFISTYFVFYKISLILCTIYHIVSICILYGYGKGHFKTMKKSLLESFFYITFGIISCLILLNTSTIILNLVAILSIVLFYVYIYKSMRKGQSICN